jgi:hypothetical protein
MGHARLTALIDVLEHPDGFACAVLVRGDRARELYRFVSRVRSGDRTTVLFQAAAHALGAARQHGRTLRVAINDADTIAVLSRRREVANEHVTPFLVIRALVHAYRRVEFVQPTLEEKAAVDLAIADALHGGGASSHLPLWSASRRSSAA